MTSALVILSGGQDSTTTLFWAKHKFDTVHAVTFNYGQRHRREIGAARDVAALAGASHTVIDCADVLVSSSPLTSSAPLEEYTDFAQMDKVIGKRIELTFVPMRNMFFFTVAINRAAALRCRDVVTGICQEDNANYPDCRETFRAAFQYAANEALDTRDFIVHAPLMYLSKAETCKMAHLMPDCWEALAWTHTSYDGEYPPIGKNHANVLRAHGFEEAGLPDPLVLRAVREGLMQLPTTPNYKGVTP